MRNRLLYGPLLLGTCLLIDPAAAGPSVRSCGVPKVDQAKVKATAGKVAAFAKAGGTVSNGGPIDVYVHIISNGSALANGSLSDAHIESQMQIINARYNPLGYSFQLKSIDRTVNERWHMLDVESPLELEVKTALRKGQARDLNIYTIGNPEFLGYASFPWDFQDNPYLDGVVLLYTTLPGVEPGPFSLGETATHEIGHWMGLMHTFGDGLGCSDRANDGVSDTAMEKGPAYGCPMARDSCRGGGKDPVHNFMNYGDDYCLREFTKGQKRRIDKMMSVFRP